MPDWIAAPWLVLLLASFALGVSSLAIVLTLQLRKQVSRDRSELARLAKDLGGLRTGAVGMGQRILAMEESQTLQRQGSSDAVAANTRPYTEATHLLSLGLDKDEVASRCGLSRAEASLLDALRKKSS
ncbi:DUF2802 domain-containing protein [Gilvimarinus sp. DA14]|uniref:DUF2802 domain-containing protein n=1 Tax=Gilvimarinus sp. DA14 TaxID=2956798 RepID=UPI0020B7B941|nr:DUF2802 domain-containing protein [Gilvimarinus sp. DA14]UTF60767.1 DUF2802 domain-containing protein [Gilvimarinus sp. DA14]